MASAAARRSPDTRVRSLASMATSVPVPMAMPRSAWASAGASLTPSPTTATRWPSACSSRDHVDLVAGQDLGHAPVDADLGGDGVGRALVVAGEPSRPRGRARAARRRRRATGGFTVSATTNTPGLSARRRRPSRRTPRCDPRPRPCWRRRSSPAGRRRTASAGRRRRVTPSTVRATPRPGVVRRRVGATSSRRAPARAATAWAIGCSDASSADAGESQQRRRPSTPGGGEHVDQLHPPLGDRAGLVEHGGRRPVASPRAPRRP